MTKRNNKLIVKVLTLGMIVAALSYLFHPEVGHLTLSFNGHPVANPLIRFAALPTFLIMAVATAVLSILLFLGVELFIFLSALMVAFMVFTVIAPYFWPLLVIIFLIITLTSLNHHDKD